MNVILPQPAQLSAYLPNKLATALLAISAATWAEIEEIRLRIGRPVTLVGGSGELNLTTDGSQHGAVIEFTAADASALVELATQSSAYAWQEQISSGYLTLPGGHRLGLAGRALVDAERRVVGIRQANSFCLRLSRAVIGASDPVLPYIVGSSGRLHSTLLVSPPRCGKTTVLRDAIRQISSGLPHLGVSPRQVSLVDERSEVAGCWQGVPSHDLGPRTDVMDACPKAAGMLTMLRAMSPDVLATDEIGRPEDVPALAQAARSGVVLLATAHGWDLDDLLAKPATKALLAGGHFSRVVLLSRLRGPGSVQRVVTADELSPNASTPELPASAAPVLLREARTGAKGA